jgi:hypothetical protein
MMTLILAIALPQELTEKSYESLKKEILPSKEELRFADIPWEMRLWDAVVKAQKEEKPILLYAMNGHPLACT